MSRITAIGFKFALLLIGLGLIRLVYLVDRVLPIEGLVFDEMTKRPVAGALVVSSWPTRFSESFSPLAGLPGSHVEIHETLTDVNGRFHIDGWISISHRGVQKLEPQIVVLKQDYRALIVQGAPVKEITQFYGNSSAPSSDKTIQLALKKFKQEVLDPTQPTLSERYLDSSYVTSAVSSMYSGRQKTGIDDCWLLKTPLLLKYLFEIEPLWKQYTAHCMNKK